MRIVHVIGPKMAGKTTLVESMRVPTWDITNFYKKNRCLDSKGSLIWPRVDACRVRLVPDLNQFILHQKGICKTCIIETSGLNLQVESYLASCGLPVAVVCLAPPTEEEFKERCAKIKGDSAAFSKYNNKWMSKAMVTGKGPMLTQSQALKRLRELI